MLAVKSNQGRLEAAFDNYFKLEMLQSDEGDTYSTQEQGHGRKETRLCLVNDDLSVLGDIAFEWPELKTMGIVATIRQEKGQPATGITLRYYISSAKLTSKQLLEASRAHWSIESQLHWRLDVGMSEGSCRIRREQAGENFAVLRHIALNLLNADTSFKVGIKRKKKRAGRNNDYLSRVLAGQGVS